MKRDDQLFPGAILLAMASVALTLMNGALAVTPEETKASSTRNAPRLIPIEVLVSEEENLLDSK